jgi:hypothetical protein
MGSSQDSSEDEAGIPGHKATGIYPSSKFRRCRVLLLLEIDLLEQLRSLSNMDRSSKLLSSQLIFVRIWFMNYYGSVDGRHETMMAQ